MCALVSGYRRMVEFLLFSRLAKQIGKKLERIKQKAGSASARAQLDALKKARSAERARATEGPKKSI